MNIESLILFVIGQILCLAIIYFLPYIMAAKDAIQIEMNGRFDSLKTRWHKLNVIIWLMSILPMNLLAVLPLAIHERYYFRSLFIYASICILARAWHWSKFDDTLNQLRGLAALYIGTNAQSDLYLKKNPNAKRNLLIVSGLAYICSVLSLFI